MVQGDAKLEQRKATRHIDRPRVRSLGHSRVPGRRQRSFPSRTARGPCLDLSPAERHAELDEEAASRITWDSEQACGATVRDESNAGFVSLAGLPDWSDLDSTSPSAGQARGIEGNRCQDLGSIQVHASRWTIELPRLA